LKNPEAAAEEWLAGDSAYGSGEMLEWLVHERGTWCSSSSAGRTARSRGRAWDHGWPHRDNVEGSLEVDD
jgi:hypothetical protein